MSWLNHIRGRPDMQRKWDLFQDILLEEFRNLSRTQECIVEKGRSTTVYAYVYKDSGGTKFLSAAVQVADSKICAMVFLKPPVWKGRDIDKSWFENISGDIRREGAESVWSPGFWEWYPGFEANGAFMRLLCNKPEELKELCVDLVRIVGWNFEVYNRHDILSNHPVH